MRRLLLGLALSLALPATASAASPQAFRSPSGNIGCYIDDSGARCDIRTRSYRAPSRPRSCDLDWGDAIGVSRRGSRGAFVCHGDTALNRDRVLRYGASIRRGTIRCTSRTDGMRCVNGRGHGFLISRARYRLF